MRDVKLITTDEDDWGVDFDIIDGQPKLLDYDSQTADQRAAVVAYIATGTVPGMQSFGVNWGMVYDKQMTLIDLNNQIEQQLQQYAAPENPGEDGVSPANQYQPIVAATDEGFGVVITKGGQA